MDPMFETVHSDVDSSFRYLHFSCAHLADDHAWHYHPEFELTWVVRSAGTRFVGDHIARYYAGDLVLLSPNLPHCWHNETPEPGGDQPELFVAQFNPESFGAGFLSLREAAPIARLLESANCGLQFTGPVVGQVGRLMRRMETLRGMGRLLCFLEVLNTLAECKQATALATHDYPLHNDINPVNRRRVELVHRFVRERLSGDISQAEIANALKLSAPAFSRFFRAATGKTFVAFVNTLRINEACRLLHDTTQSITEIAMACGYNNVSNFNRQFLALQGINPSRYRSCVQGQSQRQLHYLHMKAAG